MKHKVLTAASARRLDEWAIKRIGIPSLVLMENAGRAVTQEISKRIKTFRSATVVIVCGLGNNGADGMVVARQVLAAGGQPRIYLAGRTGALKSEAAIQARILKNLRIKIGHCLKDKENFIKDLNKADIVVDALFGCGLNRPLGEEAQTVIQLMNRSKGFRLAVDVPSGLDATTGKVWGCGVKADMTVTFTAYKRGLLLREGPRLAGKVMVADIGIPKVN